MAFAIGCGANPQSRMNVRSNTAAKTIESEKASTVTQGLEAGLDAGFTAYVSGRII
jgi:hypothetical protein